MKFLDNIKIVIARQLCLAGLTESEAHEFVGALELETKDEQTTLVTANGGINVKFTFGSDGNFSGAYAQLGGKSVPLVFGTQSHYRAVFEGPPSSNNPGPGWEIDPELSQAYFGVTGPQGLWPIFFARRVAVINNV